MIHKVSLKLGKETLRIETGKLARQANGAVLITYGETTLLVTAVMAKDYNLAIDYFPLQVNYNEKYYAVGKIPGGFIKREGRPKDKEVLVSRLIDRPLRPLFPIGFRNEVQVLPMTMSADQINPPDILGIIGSSAALSISDIPFNGPLGAVRMGLIDDEYIVNPTFEEIKKSKLELIVAGTKNAIIMIDGAAKELSEEQMLNVIKLAHKSIKEIVNLQEELLKICGKIKKEVDLFKIDSELFLEISKFAKEKIKEALKNKNKSEMSENLEKIRELILDTFLDETKENHSLEIKSIFEDIKYNIVREIIYHDNKRLDDRKMDEIRSISCDIDLFSRTHGSSLFTRGETQSLAIVTLGTSMDVQRLDDLEGEGEKNFLLHYNFPPFSVGEVGRIGGPGRREIGHGSLAEKAIIPVLPSQEVFPYTIRVVSEILESNGSSSMASVCSTSLALLAAGVPISKAVSGIAMGLITLDDQFKILTDIQGVEDHLGEMDFKVAGTKDGITAFQLDIKNEGITFDIIAKTFEQAKKARLEILDAMTKTIKNPKEFLSYYAPKIISFDVSTDKIKDIIGAGGKIIRKLTDETGANIDIDNYGKVLISSKDEKSTELAYKQIQMLITDVEVGKIYKGKVTRITDFGAFIEILPGKEGLCHISKLSKDRVKKVSDVIKEKDQVTVKCVEIDFMGRINLSMKDLHLSNKDKDK